MVWFDGLSTKNKEVIARRTLARARAHTKRNNYSRFDAHRIRHAVSPFDPFNLLPRDYSPVSICQRPRASASTLSRTENNTNEPLTHNHNGIHTIISDDLALFSLFSFLLNFSRYLWLPKQEASARRSVELAIEKWAAHQICFQNK